MKKIILIGAFHEIVELCELSEINIIGIIDNRIKNSFRGYKIFGSDNDAEKIYKDYENIPVVITPDIPEIRFHLKTIYSKIGFKFESLISPLAVISKSAKINEGCIIQSGVNISANVTLAGFVKMNSCSNVMHDCLIGQYVTIAPNAVLLGRVEIGDFAYIGANSTVLPGKKIGNSSIVGAGAVVTKNFGDRTISVGNPARILKEI